MATIKIIKREMNIAYNFEGEQYDITGNATTDIDGSVTMVNMSINDKQGQYVGDAYAYADSKESKPKINLNNIDTDIIAEVVADVKNCIAEVKQNSSKTTETE